MSCEKRKLNDQDRENDSIDKPNQTTSTNTNGPTGDKSIIEKKIRKIIESHFDEEINYKKYELEKINERVFEAQNMLDKLRVCIVCNFYSSNGRIPLNEYINHPAISNLKCEHLDAAIEHSKASNKINNVTSFNRDDDQNDQCRTIQHNEQFDVKICVGNVSKYLNNKQNEVNQSQEVVESSQYNQDLITHKWMIYIRSPNCSKLDSYFKKVIFYLHPSYRPYDVVEVKNPPFQLARRGWGEFPIHVQIHFKDARNKRIDINHNLKLDWTQTGLQTFGGETSSTSKLVIKPNDFVPDSSNQTNSKIKNQAENLVQEEVQETNSKIIEETPPISLQNELNSQYLIDSFRPDQCNGLPRNFSSSSLSSTSNSNLFSPQVNQTIFANQNPSPTNFISTDLETPSVQIQNTPSQSNTKTNSDNFDELIQNLSKDKKIELKLNPVISKPSGAASLDALLNLRPKTIQLNKPISSTIVIPPKIVQPQLNNKPVMSSVNSKIITPNINRFSNGNGSTSGIVNKQTSVTNNSFLNSLNKKLVIYKVGSDDINSKPQVSETESDKIINQALNHQ